MNFLGSKLAGQAIDSLARKDLQNVHALVNELKKDLAAQSTDSVARKDIQDLQVKLEGSKNLGNIADTVIMWSTLIITLFSILLIAAGYYTTIRVKEIKSIKTELEILQSVSEKTLKENKKSIDKSYADFENEKNLQMKLIFPLIKGENSFLQGDYFNAFYHYNEAKVISPNHPWLINFVWLLINSGRFDEAIRYLTGQLEGDSNNNDVKYYLAHVYRRQNLLEKAEKLIEPVATDNKHPLSIYEFATILFMKGEFKKAERVYKEAINYFILPDLFVYLNLAITQTINNNQTEAIVHAKRAKELIKKELLKNPNNPHLNCQEGIAKLILNETGAVDKIKLSLKKDLPSENAKSAIDKISKIPNPTSEILEAIKILQKYYVEISN
jgi:tetratricopeptide (TPR) repeat protein